MFTVFLDEATNLNKEKLNTILQSMLVEISLVEGNASIEVIEQNAENVTQTGGKIAQGFNNEFFFQNYSHRPFLPEVSTSNSKRGNPEIFSWMLTKQYLTFLYRILALDTAYRLR